MSVFTYPYTNLSEGMLIKCFAQLHGVIDCMYIVSLGVIKDCI